MQNSKLFQLGFFWVFVCSAAVTAIRGDDVSATSQDAAQAEPIAGARALSQAFRQSADRALPSVVKILTQSRRPNRETPILDIIGGEDAQVFDGVGSGVIVTEDGLVLTNHHVIADASRVEVRLHDGRQYTASELKSNPISDVAILRISVAEKLQAAEIGDSDNLHVGDWVLAIGSPFTLEASVSAGIISGTGRRRRLSASVEGQFLQTDAAINPGNSGGPLVDLEGKVIGINTAISSRTGGFQGIGFAIPIARAIWIKQELLEHGQVRRGYVGIRTRSVPYSVAKELNLPRSSAGAMVGSVVPDRPGQKAGLKAGDVIFEFAGQRIESASDFAEIVQQSRIGEPLELVIFRDGERKTLSIELEERIEVE